MGKSIIRLKGRKGNTIWMVHEEWVAWQKLQQESEDAWWAHVFWGVPLPVREPKEDDNVKLAFVFAAGKRQMVGLDNKTMKAYKLRDDCPMWKLPLEPIEYTSLERWCTSFDT